MDRAKTSCSDWLAVRGVDVEAWGEMSNMASQPRRVSLAQEPISGQEGSTQVQRLPPDDLHSEHSIMLLLNTRLHLQRYSKSALHCS
jgi:hypothetical protein